MERGELIDIVGKENVFDDPETLEEHSRDMSLVPTRKPFFVVRPGDANEVQGIVKLANKTKTPLIPVSSGPPHFRGDTVPSFSGVVMDLSRMDKIRFVDRLDRVAMIEPGVRFAELQSALEKEGMKLPAPLCPRSTKSVIGSFLEREPPTIPKYHLDHGYPLLCAEVIFGTGDLFRTGEAAGPGEPEDRMEAGWRHKYPSEPQTELLRTIQGSQGSLGIVTWATVKCEVKPTVQRPYFALGSLDDLLEFGYRLVRLRLCDELFILNARDMGPMMGAEPEAWALFFCLSGYNYFPEEKVEYEEEDARRMARELSVEVRDSVCGISAEGALKTATSPSIDPYWKVREKGNCQDIYFLSSFYNISRSINSATRALNEKGIFDIGVYIQPICQGHGHHCELSLFYDGEDMVEREKVKDAYLSLITVLMQEGAFFSRPYDLIADMVYSRDQVTKQALKRVKGVFDPNDVLNPGKIVPPEVRM
jgi:hypothetical protein